MSNVLKKLQFKDHDPILVIHAPNEFQIHLDEISAKPKVDRDLSADRKYDFVIVFVRNCAEIKEWAAQVVSRSNEDAILWLAYPKKSSKKYTTDISRDDGWQPFGDLGYEGVRQVAIDADWSALRFRHVNFIKKFTRKKARTMSKAGKERAQ